MAYRVAAGRAGGWWRACGGWGPAAGATAGTLGRQRRTRTLDGAALTGPKPLAQGGHRVSRSRAASKDIAAGCVYAHALPKRQHLHRARTAKSVGVTHGEMAAPWDPFSWRTPEACGLLAASFQRSAEGVDIVGGGGGQPPRPPDEWGGVPPSPPPPPLDDDCNYD